jgi:hypothetical protein
MRAEAQASARNNFIPPKLFLATRTPVPVRTSQAWLRWFNSAFASRLYFGCKVSPPFNEEQTPQAEVDFNARPAQLNSRAQSRQQDRELTPSSA